MQVVVEITIKGLREKGPGTLFTAKSLFVQDAYLERTLEVPTLPRVGERFTTSAFRLVKDCRGIVRDVQWIVHPDGTVGNCVAVDFDMGAEGKMVGEITAALEAEGWKSLPDSGEVPS